jgi:phosphonate degradation associated HDIG domain protein
MSISDEIFAVFENRGAEAYYGEAVSMLEHSLQAAHFARLAHAPDSLVLAALLHDAGHLIEDVPADLADWHEDAQHEEKGAAWLAQFFGPAICNPVRLHVPAKRYLCATDASYLSKLSAASVVTLKLQGGPMNSPERAAFERIPHHQNALRVRRWDDAGKVAGLATAGLEDYRKLIDRFATA